MRPLIIGDSSGFRFLLTALGPFSRYDGWPRSPLTAVGSFSRYDGWPRSPHSLGTMGGPVPPSSLRLRGTTAVVCSSLIEQALDSGPVTGGPILLRPDERPLRLGQ